MSISQSTAKLAQRSRSVAKWESGKPERLFFKGKGSPFFTILGNIYDKRPNFSGTSTIWLTTSTAFLKAQRIKDGNQWCNPVLDS